MLFTHDYRLSVGMYFHHMRTWLQYFPLEQIKVVDSEAFVQNPVPVLKDIESFLNVPHYIQPRHFNKTVQRGKKTFFCVNKKDGCMGSGKGRTHPDIAEKTIRTLRDYYKPFNEQFFNLVGKRMIWAATYNQTRL